MKRVRIRNKTLRILFIFIGKICIDEARKMYREVHAQLGKSDGI